MTGGQGIDEFCAGRGLVASEALLAAHERPPAAVESLLYRPDLPPDAPPSIAWACQTVDESAWPLPADLLPVLPVDDASFACAVAAPEPVDARVPDSVVRWHLDVEDPVHQGALLDTDLGLYVTSVAEELSARDEGLKRMLDQIGPWYEKGYLANEKRPKDFVLRPVRLACQNVIAGLAAFSQDSTFDGMAVLAWQTCELPHIGTHEANRALAALMLCDAYQSGGTMEIRFDRPAELTFEEVEPLRYQGHPEMTVPASLRRYGRTVGVELGGEDPAAISPAEARALFLAVTPMPGSLGSLLRNSARGGAASPERLCFTLLSGIWRDIEVDFLLAVSPRAGDILRGGADWEFRAARQAESQLARAALMVGMLHRRLDTKDAAGAAGEARVLEDTRAGVGWSVIEELAAVEFSGLRTEPMPWQSGGVECVEGQPLIVFPRPSPTVADVEAVRSVSAVSPAALVVPGDAVLSGLDLSGLVVLRCPDRLGELDLAIEAKLLKLRMARA